MMKSPGDKSGVEEPVFHWNHDASRTLHNKGRSRLDHPKKLNLDKYFDFLEEFKPHIHELRRTRIFEKPFTIV